MFEIRIYTKSWGMIKKDYCRGDRQHAELYAEKMRDELDPSGYFEIERVR